MSFFRSQIILHKFVRIPKDQSIEIFNEIGKMDNAVEFIDLNINNQEAKKNYYHIIKQCEDMERIINNFEHLSSKYGYDQTPYSSYNQFNKDLEKDIEDAKIYNNNYFDQLEVLIKEDEKRLKELVNSCNSINENLNNLLERRNVYEVCLNLTKNNANDNSLNNKSVFELNNSSIDNSDIINNSINDNFNDNIYNEKNTESAIKMLAGVIKTEDQFKMQRMLYRITRGRATVTFYSFPDIDKNLSNMSSLFSEQNQEIANNLNNKEGFSSKNIEFDFGKKSIFIIFFPSSGIENIILSKIIRTCEVFQASRYNIPNAYTLTEKIKEISNDIDSSLNYLKSSHEAINEYIKSKVNLEDNNQPGKYQLYKLYFKKEKMMYQAKSFCVLRDNFLDAEIFISPSNFKLLLLTIENMYKNNEGKIFPVFEDVGDKDSRSSLLYEDNYNAKITLPTLIKTNEFTWIFQEIVNLYGIPRYQEINPALFTIITFPFLFGVMFGDIGHGGLLLAFGIYLCLFVYKSQVIKTSLYTFYRARYLILLMGIFAFYCGWMYNDFFSLPIGIFGSCYDNYYYNNATSKLEIINSNTFDNINTNILASDIHVKLSSENCVYPFGVDPKWHSASNELSFMNSLKMKLSVIFGVIHMLLGITMKGLNSLYFGSKTEFIFEFIPQIIFMTFLFGYMNIMIIIKWCTDWSDKKPPSIISLLLNIFLKLGSVEGKPLYGDIDGSTQEGIHKFIFIVCMICVPLMLIPKPIINYCKTKNNKQSHEVRLYNI